MIVNEATEGLGDEIRAGLTLPNLKRTVQRQRVRVDAAPSNPRSLTDLVIPSSYQVILLDNDIGEEQFLFYDSGPSADRILIFSTSDNLRLLALSRKWMCDGTFKIAPSFACQLYTVHASYLQDYVPLVYALLPDKSEATYIRFFTQLKNLAPTAQPHSVMTDFEMAAVNAITNVFQTPNNDLNMQGCFFHLSQNIAKRIQSEGLQSTYESNPLFALMVRHIAAIAFVPENDVLTAYEALEEILPTEAFPILDYFERTYIGRRVGAQRRPPLFRIDFWNVHNQVLNDDPRTNNKVEGHHNLINSTLGYKHPTIWKFIDGLKKLQHGNKTRIACLISQGAPRRKKVYVDQDARIKNICQNYHNRSISDYLRGIAHNLQFNSL